MRPQSREVKSEAAESCLILEADRKVLKNVFIRLVYHLSSSVEPDLMFIVTQGSVLVMVTASLRLLRGLRLTLTWPWLQGDLALSLSVWLELAGR